MGAYARWQQRRQRSRATVGGHTPNNGLTETCSLGLQCTVLLRRNLTGNANATGYRTDTERIWERERNRHRMGTERISNGYGTVTDQKKEKKAFWNANNKRMCSSEHMVASYAIRVLTKDVKHDTILNTCSSNFCQARRSWENDRTNRLMSFFLFLFTHAKQASSLHLLVHFMFVAAILLLSTSPSYDQIRK